jgi:plastocyanin
MRQPEKEKLRMFKPFFRRQIFVIMLMALLVLTFTLSACGETAPAAPAGSTSAGGGTTAAVTITETTGGNDVYAFAPTTLSIKAGDSVKWTNNSDENHKLVMTPAGPTAAPTAARSGSNDNTATVTFAAAGTFTVTSKLVDRLKDGKHTPDPADSHATITITVS